MADYRKIKLSELAPGTVLATPLFDDRFAKLLDAGATIDQHLIDRLTSFGITEVAIESAAECITKQPMTPLPSGVPAQPTDSDQEIIRIDRCSSCGAVIALRPPMPDAKACAWRCKSCSAVYFGSEDAGAQCRGVVRCESNVDSVFVAPIETKSSFIAPSIQPENAKRLVKALASGKHGGPNRRRQKRYTVTVPVVALPLAPDFRIDGEPVQMTTANVSLGGAALMHTRFIDAPYLALDFTVAGVELLQIV